MEKIKLNNQIVLMRKYVKQAKVHVINKLVKQAKLLQNRKGNEVQIQKAKRKAERFLETITLLKKIRPDEVSKLALSKTSNWDEILQQKNSTLNDRCIAMLASYNTVQKEVKAFQSSNKDLVLKISELIKQWDEKNKYSNTSPKSKIERESRKKEKKTNINMLNYSKNKTDISKTQLVSEEEKRIGNMNKCSTNKSDKQNKFSIHSSEISVPNVIHNTDAVETTSQEEADCLKNIPKEDNLKENMIGVENSENEESEEGDESVGDGTENQKTIKISENENKVIKTDNYKELERNKMEITDSDSNEESEQEDSESEDNGTESHQEIKIPENKNNVIKLEQSSTSELIRKIDNDANSSENKMKAIALLNLDELEGLDEIPVSSKAVRDPSDEFEVESSEDEASKASYNRRNDPFFLGCSDEACVADVKLASFPKNNFLSNYSNKASKSESNSFFQRKGNFQKFSNDTHFSRKDGGKFQKERDNFKPFQKIKPTTRNYQGKFQPRNKNAFNRSNSKNQDDFKTKSKAFQNYKEKGHEDSSKYTKNNGDKFSTKHLEHKKGNTSDKPLHPSWEAKRKQKELINTSFQGKRMVFGD